jgi:hypothetical protein
MKPVYLLLNAKRSTWLQVAAPGADGYPLHHFPQSVDCLRDIAIVIVGWICLCFTFLALDHVYDDVAMSM